MALAKKHRLPKKDIELVFKRGRTVHGSFFFIRLLKNNVGYMRVAISISSKVCKKATERNRFKRIITETIWHENILERSLDIVVVATRDIVGKLKKEINREVEQTINKLFSQTQ